MTTNKNVEEKLMKEFDEKFLYWVVLGSTLNDGSELRWNVGDDQIPSIEEVKKFILHAHNEGIKVGLEKAVEVVRENVSKEGYPNEKIPQEISDRLEVLIENDTQCQLAIADMTNYFVDKFSDLTSSLTQLITSNNEEKNENI